MRSSSELKDRRMSITRPEKSIRAPIPAPAAVSGTAFSSAQDLDGSGVGLGVVATGVVVGAGVVVVVVGVYPWAWNRVRLPRLAAATAAASSPVLYAVSKVRWTLDDGAHDPSALSSTLNETRVDPLEMLRTETCCLCDSLISLSTALPAPGSRRRMIIAWKELTKDAVAAGLERMAS